MKDACRTAEQPVAERDVRREQRMQIRRLPRYRAERDGVEQLQHRLRGRRHRIEHHTIEQELVVRRAGINHRETTRTLQQHPECLAERHDVGGIRTPTPPERVDAVRDVGNQRPATATCGVERFHLLVGAARARRTTPPVPLHDRHWGRCELRDGDTAVPPAREHRVWNVGGEYSTAATFQRKTGRPWRRNRVERSAAAATEDGGQRGVGNYSSTASAGEIYVIGVDRREGLKD